MAAGRWKGVSAAGLALMLAAALMPAAVRADGPAGDPARGEQLFKRCRACHSVEPGRNKIGPSLYGVVGRKAGTAPGYAYSPALKGAEWVLTEEMLDKWIAGPKKVLPGTKMIFPGLPNPQDRADVIAFLKQHGPAEK
ncbi:MAG: hypothetical protein KatS3mg119_2207 [Rhodothalassiaceae bacterium]|nr:MAG: hypothetical protein KatS3mg119_2207 [Rhodothalassiaceae bacterium]